MEQTITIPDVEPVPEPQAELVPAVEVPVRFPMCLREYADNVNLDPLLEAALRVWVPTADRLQSEWDVLLTEYQHLPIV